MTDERLRDRTATVIQEERVVKSVRFAPLVTLVHRHAYIALIVGIAFTTDGLSVDHHWYPKQDEGLVARDSPERAGAR